MIGTDTRCCKCGTPMISCVVPAICGRCNGTIERMKAALLARKDEADKPIVVEAVKKE